MSDTTDGWQKQLNGLANFCSHNFMILNEMKTKILVFGKNQQVSNVKDIYFNGKVIHRSKIYKYLGNLLSGTQTNQGDIFRYTYEHLCNKARNAVFSIEKKLNHLARRLRFDIEDTNITHFKLTCKIMLEIHLLRIGPTR